METSVPFSTGADSETLYEDFSLDPPGSEDCTEAVTLTASSIQNQAEIRDEENIFQNSGIEQELLTVVPPCESYASFIPSFTHTNALPSGALFSVNYEPKPNAGFREERVFHFTGTSKVEALGKKRLRDDLTLLLPDVPPEKRSCEEQECLSVSKYDLEASSFNDESELSGALHDTSQHQTVDIDNGGSVEKKPSGEPECLAVIKHDLEASSLNVKSELSGVLHDTYQHQTVDIDNGGSVEKKPSGEPECLAVIKHDLEASSFNIECDLSGATNGTKPHDQISRIEKQEDGQVNLPLCSVVELHTPNVIGDCVVVNSTNISQPDYLAHSKSPVTSCKFVQDLNQPEPNVTNVVTAIELKPCIPFVKDLNEPEPNATVRVPVTAPVGAPKLNDLISNPPYQSPKNSVSATVLKPYVPSPIKPWPRFLGKVAPPPLLLKPTPRMPGAETFSPPEYADDLADLGKNFVSNDPSENADNNSSGWDVLRGLLNTEQRFIGVRRRWGNKAVPDPNRDLSFRFSRHVVEPTSGDKPSQSSNCGEPRSQRSDQSSYRDERNSQRSDQSSYKDQRSSRLNNQSSYRDDRSRYRDERSSYRNQRSHNGSSCGNGASAALGRELQPTVSRKRGRSPSPVNVEPVAKRARFIPCTQVYAEKLNRIEKEEMNRRSSFAVLDRDLRQANLSHARREELRRAHRMQADRAHNSYQRMRSLLAKAAADMQHFRSFYQNASGGSQAFFLTQTEAAETLELERFYMDMHRVYVKTD